jgi:hypothetical protein
MVAADVGRVPIVESHAMMRLVGLVSRKDLLRIRATAKSMESSRVAFFGRRTPATDSSAESAPAAS